MRYAGVVAVLLVLSGCAAPGPQHAVVQTDQFEPTATVRGPAQFENPFGGIARSWNLRTIIDKKTGIAADQLYVDLSYVGDWKFFNRASDENAHELKVRQIDRSVGGCYGGCSLYEAVGIDLDDAVLRAHAKTGYRIKLSAHSGDALILPITPAMIAEQVRVVDAYQAARVSAK